MRENRRIKEPIVAITKALTEGKSLEKALDLLPIDKIIKKGDKVIITPNWVKDKSPKEGVVVGPKTLQKLIQYVKTKEPSAIYIATGSGGAETPTVIKSVGYDKVIEDENIEFIYGTAWEYTLTPVQFGNLTLDDMDLADMLDD